MYCYNCGKELVGDAKFCGNCGKPVQSTEIKDTTTDKEHNEEPISSQVSSDVENNVPVENEIDNTNQIESTNEALNNEIKNGEEGSNLPEITENLPLIDNTEESLNNKLSLIGKIKNNRIAFFAVIAAIVFTMGIIGGAFYISSNNTKQNNLLTAMKKTDSALDDAEKIMSTFDDYITDDFKSDIDTLHNRFTEQKNKKDLNEAQKFLEDVKSFQTKLQQNNKSTIDNMLKEVNGIDTVRATDDELKMIKDYDSNVSGFVNDNKYIKARDELTKWKKLLDEINVIFNNYNISVNQIDFSNFPKIRVYLNIEDKNTKEVPKNIDPKFFYISEKNANNPDYIKQSILKAIQLDQQESLNINMVADISGSMTGSPLNSAKFIMSNFLDRVQFNAKDKVELTAFSTGVQTYASFTDNKDLLKRQISSFRTGDSTALYDALFAAVNTTAVQDGAKCVIAFTDGYDNYSKMKPNDVIEVAKRYNIPIFIIGIGSSVDSTQLQNIAISTNGLYKSINNISDMSEIYNSIYKKNKQMYIVEYETQNKDNISDVRNIKIDVQTRKDGGGATFSFTPRFLMSTQATVNHSDKINELIGSYLTNYIHAINNHNYSYIEKYIIPGGGVEKEVRPYIMNNIQEKLLSYEVVKKEFIDDNTCKVTTRETYEVQNHEQPLHMRVLEGCYEIKKQPDGSWKLLNFAELYKVLSQINY